MKQTKLKTILKNMNFSIRALSEKCDMKYVTLHKKISGNVEFTYTEVYKICKALGIENPLEVFLPEIKKRDGNIPL